MHNHPEKKDALRALADALDLVRRAMAGERVLASAQRASFDLLHRHGSEMRAALARADAVAPEGAVHAYMQPETFNAASREDFEREFALRPNDYRGWYPVYTRPSAAPAAETGTRVDDAMVERFCASFVRGQWPTQSKHNDDGIRAMVREALTDALATPAQDAAHGGRHG